MTTLPELIAGLQAKSGFEVIEHSETSGQLRLFGRVRSDMTSANINNWLLVVRNLLRTSSVQAGWKADISKQYFLRGDAGAEKVLYGWRLILQGENISQHYASIAKAVKEAPETASTEVTEYPLPGATANRNATDGKKRGAYSARG